MELRDCLGYGILFTIPAAVPGYFRIRRIVIIWYLVSKVVEKLWIML